MPNATQSAACEAIHKAITGKPVGTGSYAEVVAVDVIAVGELVNPAAATEITKALVMGARGAIKGSRAGVVIRVQQIADQLRHLLEAAEMGKPATPLE